MNGFYLTLAQISSVVPCGNESGPSAATSCDLADFVLMIKNIINVLVLFSIPVTMIVLTWVGIMLLTARGSQEKITKAKGMAGKVLTGFIIILFAWFVVNIL